MIGCIYTGASVSGLASYLDAAKALDSVEQPLDSRLVAVRPWALGLEETLSTDWIEAKTDRRTLFRKSIAALRAISRTRPDLRHRVAHITLSADPSQILMRGLEQTRRDYLQIFRAVADAVGLSDRCGVLVLHADGHTAARQDMSGPLEHLHAIVVLADPDTGRSIALHSIRRRVRTACRAAAADLPSVTPRPEIEDNRILRTPFEPTPPVLAVPTALREVVKRPLRRRQRSWEIDL